MDLVDEKLSNEHLFLTKVKVPTTPLFTFFGDRLKPTSLLSNPQTKEKGGKLKPQVIHMVQCKCWFYQQQDVVC
jgi:hypothetical protein